MTIQSTSSYDEIVGTINASLSILPKQVTDGIGGAIDNDDDADAGKIEASFSQEQKNVFNSFKIDMLVLGGSASNAASLMTVNTLEDYSKALSSFIKEGAEWSPESPGVMLSYKLRHLSDNSVANIVMADRYKVRDCSRTKFIFRVEMTKWNVQTNDPGYEAEIKGAVRAEVRNPKGEIIKTHTFWDKKNPVDIEQKAIYTNFDNPIFTFEHDSKNSQGDISAEGYTVRLFTDKLIEVDAFSDDALNAVPINVNLGDHQLLLNTQEKIMKVTGDGYINMHFNISAQ